MLRKISILLFVVSTLVFTSCDDFLDSDPSNTAERLVGTWSVEENSASYGEQHYLTEIYVDQVDTSYIKIYNFFGFGSWTFTLVEIDGMSMTIPDQNDEGYDYKGTGTISNNFDQLEFSFEVKDEQDVNSNYEPVSAIFTRSDE